MRILHVDDSADDRTLVAHELRRDWPEAELFQVGGAEALERVLAEVGEFDVAVLDFALGWGDGLGVLRRVRERQPDLPALLFTGSLGEDRAVQMIHAGFDDYVVKAVDRLPRLRTSVRTCIERREERRARARAEARHRDLFLNLAVGLFVCRPDGTLEDGNPALLRMLGLGSTEELHRLNLLDLIASEEIRHRWLEIPPAEVRQVEIELRRPDGETLWVQLDARAPGKESGTIEGVLTDVTALQAALEQKDTLLREVLHRVYNNLQQVEGLLNLQGRRFAQPEVRRAFKEVGDRVRALALVQRKLHGGADYRSVDFAAYLHDLSKVMSNMTGRSGVHIIVEAEPVAVRIERAMPAGLIANELLTNGLKHAFPGSRGGEIRVVFRSEADGHLTLGVKDNGVGLRGTSSKPEDGGLGTRLLPALARELGGAVVTEGGNGGFSVTVRFPP